MSIKAIHIFLISCAIILSFLFALWSFLNAQTIGGQTYFMVSAGAFVAGVALVFYGIHFIKKVRTLT